MDLEHLKRLAGIDNTAEQTPSVGENVSHSATEKAEYQRKYNIRPGHRNGLNYGLQDLISQEKILCLANLINRNILYDSRNW